MKTRHFANQTGVTLVELMIALAISAILMLGVSSIYVSSKRGYKIQDNLSRQQENSRFSLEVLMRDLRMAGYPKTVIKEPIVTATTSDGGTSNDTITIQYETNFDCLGQPTPACVDDAMKNCAVNKYYIKVDASGNKNLYCLGNGSANEDIIAENVTDLQIEYGLDKDTSGSANGYFTWNNLTASEIPYIVSVRFALLSQTPNDIKKVDVNKSYVLLDKTVPYNDKRIHQVYTNTVLLRNRLQ
ncbi:MAG: prepilin-type N-terminal cleavage/methylation domain-containing protein [Gammaproteobacteria bacterium]|nr:prepilin-type N-terminal cleavage/methylation domain-containing protein [Gammaproteobacteria bacterium]